MSLRGWVGVALVAVLFSATGCGGDPIELCEGCGTPTPVPTFTPEPTESSTPASPAPSTSPSTSTSPGSER